MSTGEQDRTRRSHDFRIIHTFSGENTKRSALSDQKKLVVILVLAFIRGVFDAAHADGCGKRTSSRESQAQSAPTAPGTNKALCSVPATPKQRGEGGWILCRFFIQNVRLDCRNRRLKTRCQARRDQGQAPCRKKLHHAPLFESNPSDRDRDRRSFMD